LPRSLPMSRAIRRSRGASTRNSAACASTKRRRRSCGRGGLRRRRGEKFSRQDRQTPRRVRARFFYPRTS
jgi:hypothetical protein